MFKSIAELDYYNSWVIAKCDDGLLDYYRWWFWRKRGIWLEKPKWGAHISIIRGKEEINPVSFLFEYKRDNPKIEFYYSNLIEQHEKGYVWLPVWSKDLNNVREECGLPSRPIMGFHMTIGRSELA